MRLFYCCPYSSLVWHSLHSLSWSEIAPSQFGQMYFLSCCSINAARPCSLTKRLFSIRLAAVFRLAVVTRQESGTRLFSIAVLIADHAIHATGRKESLFNRLRHFHGCTSGEFLHWIDGSHLPQLSQVCGQLIFHSKYSSLEISFARSSCRRTSHSRINSFTRPYWKYIPTGACAGQSSLSLYRTAVSSDTFVLPGLLTSWNRRIAPSSNRWHCESFFYCTRILYIQKLLDGLL